MAKSDALSIPYFSKLEILIVKHNLGNSDLEKRCLNFSTLEFSSVYVSPFSPCDETHGSLHNVPSRGGKYAGFFGLEFPKYHYSHGQRNILRLLVQKGKWSHLWYGDAASLGTALL